MKRLPWEPYIGLVTNACTYHLLDEGNIPEDLIPPSHFASSSHSTGANRCVQIPTKKPPNSWINPGMISAPSEDSSLSNPWIALTQAQQEILELKRETQRLLMLQGGSIRTPLDYRADQRARYLCIKIYIFRNTLPVIWVGIRAYSCGLFLICRSEERGDNWSRWESEWRLEAEKHRAEAERLKGQVEALKEIAERCREDIRDKDCR